MTTRNVFKVTLIASAFWISSALANPVAPPDVPALTAAADLIVVATATDQRTSGTPLDGKESFLVHPHRVLKGTWPNRPHAVVVELKLSDFSPFVAASEFGMFFLRRDKYGHYAITDPNNPVLVASPLGDTPGSDSNDVLDRVTMELARMFTVPREVAASPALSRPFPPIATPRYGEAAYSYACDALQSIPGEIALPMIKAVIETAPEPMGRAWAAGCALYFGDLTYVQFVKPLLMSSPSDDELAAFYFANAIMHPLFSAQALPVLRQLLKSQNVSARRGAAYALRGIKDKVAASALIAALSDDDSMVRTYAVLALCELTGACRGSQIDYYAKTENVGQFMEFIHHEGGFKIP